MMCCSIECILIARKKGEYKTEDTTRCREIVNLIKTYDFSRWAPSHPVKYINQQNITLEHDKCYQLSPKLEL